jgi:P2 family phage contractile tail tube protein
MANFFVMEAANLFVGDHDLDNSKHLTLAELKLPDLVEITADHHPGGAKVAIDVGLGIQKMEPTFKLNGWDPLMLREFGLGSTVVRAFTAYGLIVDKQTGRNIEAKAVMRGRLGRIAADTFSRGELQGHEYSINSLVHYELWFDGREELYWDFFTNAWRTGGVDQNAEMNRILRISG